MILFCIFLKEDILDKFEMFNKHINDYDVEITNEEIEKLLNAVKLTKDLMAKMKNNPLIYPKNNN